jgi:isopenicillin-N N-acyltransferase-like protein
MRFVRLEGASSPLERGRAHGRAWAAPIAEIARIRTRLVREQGGFRSDDDVLRLARRHLPILDAFDAPLAQELRGIAEGAGLDPAALVVLNHYTDLKDLHAAALDEVDDDCSAIVAATVEGALLGQTWDMHGTAAPFVSMLHVPAHDARPEAWLLSIVGCLGMAGMNAHGVGVTINNLRSNDARVGLVWPAVVRRALAEPTAEDAARIVETAPLGSGHHYLVADATRAIGIETSGRLAERWKELSLANVGARFHHENHCLGTVVTKVSSISPVSTTLERHAWLERSLTDRPLAGRDDLWARLGSHDGYPRSICTHLATADAPDAMLTCAGIAMNLTQRRMWAVAGCVHDGTPVELAFEGAGP